MAYKDPKFSLYRSKMAQSSAASVLVYRNISKSM